MSWPSPRIVYHRRYNIGLMGLEKLHPFDSRKYGHAWTWLRRHFGRRLKQFRIKPPRPVSEAELLAVHTPEYLQRLRDPAYLAGVNATGYHFHFVTADRTSGGHVLDLSAASLGSLLQALMTATAVAGELWDVDAFDQPGVEAGKQHMYRLLGRK